MNQVWLMLVWSSELDKKWQEKIGTWQELATFECYSCLLDHRNILVKGSKIQENLGILNVDKGG